MRDDKIRETQDSKVRLLEYRHNLLLDALKRIGAERIIRETAGGLITLLPTGAALVALKAVEKDQSYDEE